MLEFLPSSNKKVVSVRKLNKDNLKEIESWYLLTENNVTKQLF